MKNTKREYYDPNSEQEGDSSPGQENECYGCTSKECLYGCLKGE